MSALIMVRPYRPQSSPCSITISGRNHHLCTFIHEKLCGSEADTGVAAGDQNHFFM
jgi:hypothetical protein